MISRWFMRCASSGIVHMGSILKSSSFRILRMVSNLSWDLDAYSRKWSPQCSRDLGCWCYWERQTKRLVFSTDDNLDDRAVRRVYILSPNASRRLWLLYQSMIAFLLCCSIECQPKASPSETHHINYKRPPVILDMSNYTRGQHRMPILVPRAIDWLQVSAKLRHFRTQHAG